MSESPDTPVTFSRDEIRQIRELMSTPRARVVCPLCEATLMLTGPIEVHGKTGPTFEVTCRGIVNLSRCWRDFADENEYEWLPRLPVPS
jgi:hypothetical protein